jgi:hypothetical protein
VWATAGILAVVVAGAAFWLQSRPDTEPVDAGATDGGLVVTQPATPPEPSPGAPPSDPMPTERVMQLATASLRAGNYRAALASAREVLALDATHAEAMHVRDQAETMLARFDGEVAEARRLLSNGNLEGAARAIERARAIDATSPSLLELNARLSAAYRLRENAVASAPPPVVQPSPGTTPVPAAPLVSTVPPTVAAPPAPPPAPANVAAVRPDPPPLPAPSTVPAPPVTKEAAPPAVERPAAPARTDASEDAAIRQLIASYGRAIETKDIRLFRTIKPNLTAEEERRLQDGFRAVNSQRVNLTVLSIDRTDNRATAQIRRRDEIEAGGRRQSTDARQTLNLVRSASGWVIVEIH